MTRVQLTDEDWQFIGPYLPIGEYGPYPGRLRQQFEGVIWRTVAGDADAVRCLIDRSRPLPAVAGRRGLRGPAGGLDRGGRKAG